MIATRWLTLSSLSRFRPFAARPTSTPRCLGVRPCRIVGFVTTGPRLAEVLLGQLSCLAEKSPASTVPSRPPGGVKSAQVERVG